ncbi:Uncharacterised protein [Mycobacterium tuberculosis]|nr:Uncharacterised protein [Mycobacterium tuberculosis]
MPARIAPLLRSAPASSDSPSFATSVPALLSTAFATLAVRRPTAVMIPRVLSTRPPAARLASPALVSVPPTLIRSPLVEICRLPALSLPPVLSNWPTFALKLRLTSSVPPALLNLAPVTAMVATLRVPPVLSICGVLSVIGPPA